MRGILLLLLAVFPLSAAEIAFSDAFHGPAPSHQFAPAIASNGSDYLLVWSDQRSGAVEMWAARVSGRGEVLDPTGIRLGAETACERAVLWTGSEWLVIWSTGDGRLWESRLTAEGAVRHHARLLTDGVQAPSVLKSGDLTVVGYTSMGSPFEPRALFVDGEGRVINDFALASGSGMRQAPQLASNGGELVAVWTAGPLPHDVTIEGVRFNQSGVLDASPKTLVDDGSPLVPRIASNGSAYLLVTRENATRNDSARRIGAGLSDVGEPTTLPSGGSGRTRVLPAGTGYVVIAEDGFSIGGFRLDEDGKLRDSEVASLQQLDGIASAATPVVASNGESLYLAWSGRSNTATGDDSYDIYGATVSASLSPAARRLVSASASRQESPLLVAGGETLLTLWNEGSQLFARRFGTDGAAVDEDSLRLTASASSASAAFDGTSFLVAWRDADGSRVTTMRVPVSGVIDLDLQAARQVQAPAALASASDGGATLVAWVSEGELQLVRLASDGRIGNEAPLVVGRGEIDSVAIAASHGGGFLLVWGERERRADGSAVPATVRGAIVTADLSISSFPGFEIADSDAAEGDPAVTWNGSEWLVAWHRSTFTRSEFRARHITTSGWPVEGSARDRGVLIAENASSPQVAWDGSRYHFGWHSRSAQGADEVLSIASSRSLSSPGSDVTEAGVAGEGRIQFARVGDGRVAIAYPRIAQESVYGGVGRAFLEAPAPQTRRRPVR